MKKLLSLALVLAMVLAMSTTAFATEITGNSGSTDITYTYEAPVDSYVVTIPDSMEVGTDANVSIKDVVLAVGYQLTVSISSTQYDNGWKLQNNGDTLNYTLKIDGTDVTNNGTVLTAKNGNEVSKTLVTAVPEGQKPKYSGSYTDTLTFSVSVVDTSINATAMTTDQLNAAVAAELAAGKTDITVAMTSTPEAVMFAAIRNALTDSDGVTDGSINLTLKGVTTIPHHSDTNWVYAVFGEMFKDRNGNYLNESERVTQLASVNLPDVLTIGVSAFNGCKNLTVLTAPKVQTIGKWAFCESGLSSVNLPEATTIDDSAFFGCSKATEFCFPKVTVLGDQSLDLGDINNEVTIYLTSADEIAVHKDCFYQMVNWYDSLLTKVNLVLNGNHRDQVSENTWTTKDANGDEVSFTFKSITFAD